MTNDQSEHLEAFADLDQGPGQRTEMTEEQIRSLIRDELSRFEALQQAETKKFTKRFVFDFVWYVVARVHDEYTGLTPTILNLLNFVWEVLEDIKTQDPIYDRKSSSSKAEDNAS